MSFDKLVKIRIIFLNMQPAKEKTKENKPVPARPSFMVAASKECLQVDKTRINFCKYPIFASSFKQLSLNVELLDYFAETQKRDFHMIKIKTETASKLYPRVFTFKIVESGEEVTEMEIPIK